MQGVNRVDSFSQFMSLVQDARSRNQALSGAKTVAGPAKPVRSSGYQAVSSVRPMPAPAATAVSQATTNVKTKTLGSYFDSYA